MGGRGLLGGVLGDGGSYFLLKVPGVVASSSYGKDSLALQKVSGEMEELLLGVWGSKFGKRLIDRDPEGLL